MMPAKKAANARRATVSAASSNILHRREEERGGACFDHMMRDCAMATPDLVLMHEGESGIPLCAGML
jgi:hypothetical protein